VALAAAILLLGILAGPTFGALLAAPLFMPLLKMAGVSPRAAALVLVPALMLSYARPALGLSLLAPAFGGAARRISAAEAWAIAAGVVVVLGFAVFMAASGE
jgi:TRAP-type C4-dicarboxylate transport system permease large subunit